MLVAFVISSVTWQRGVLEQKVRRWQVKYGLTESEVREPLEVELEYHGNGNPLPFRPARTDADRAAHRREIGELLGHDNPARFQETGPE